MTDHEQTSADMHPLAELLVPYALGQLDEHDVVRVRAALDEHPELRAELAQIEATSARVIGSVPVVRAPASLRANVLGAVAAAAAPHEAPAVQKLVTQQPVVQAQPISLASRRRWRFVVPSIAAVGVAASVVLGVVAFQLSDELDSTQSELKAVDATPAVLEDSTILPVSTSGTMSSTSGSLIQLDDERMLLVLRGVPEPGDGNSWQVWTASSTGAIENVAQWMGGGSTQALVIEARDITDVMVSFETSTAPVPAPTSEPVAAVAV